MLAKVENVSEHVVKNQNIMLTENECTELCLQTHLCIINQMNVQ